MRCLKTNNNTNGALGRRWCDRFQADGRAEKRLWRRRAKSDGTDFVRDTDHERGIRVKIHHPRQIRNSASAVQASAFALSLA